MFELFGFTLRSILFDLLFVGFDCWFVVLGVCDLNRCCLTFGLLFALAFLFWLW